MKDKLRGKEIVLGVTGSIAAFKAAELVSRLVQRGAGVTVVLTHAGAQFVGPLTFQALTRRRVLMDAFDTETIAHVAAAEEADVVVVAPATANFLGKAAHGIADDLLTALVLAAECPLLVAPAMNERMWKNAAVKENIATLRRRGARFVEPGTGYLACGTHGVGRLADPERILADIEKSIDAESHPGRGRSLKVGPPAHHSGVGRRHGGPTR